MLLLSVIEACQCSAPYQHHPTPRGEPEAFISALCWWGKPQVNQHFSISAPFFHEQTVRAKQAPLPEREAWEGWSVHDRVDANSSMQQITCKFQTAHNYRKKTPPLSTLRSVDWTPLLGTITGEHMLLFLQKTNAFILWPELQLLKQMHPDFLPKNGKIKRFLKCENQSKGTVGWWKGVILGLARRFGPIRSGRVVVEREEIAAQYWADCHVRQWGSSETELPWIVHSFH